MPTGGSGARVWPALGLQGGGHCPWQVARGAMPPSALCPPPSDCEAHTARPGRGLRTGQRPRCQGLKGGVEGVHRPRDPPGLPAGTWVLSGDEGAGTEGQGVRALCCRSFSALVFSKGQVFRKTPRNPGAGPGGAASPLACRVLCVSLFRVRVS